MLVAFVAIHAASAEETVAIQTTVLESEEDVTIPPMPIAPVVTAQHDRTRTMETAPTMAAALRLPFHAEIAIMTVSAIASATADEITSVAMLMTTMHRHLLTTGIHTQDRHQIEDVVKGADGGLPRHLLVERPHLSERITSCAPSFALSSPLVSHREISGNSLRKSSAKTLLEMFAS